MTFRLVDKAWDSEIAAALPWSKGRIRIVCPFIKKKALPTHSFAQPPRPARHHAIRHERSRSTCQ